MTNSKSTKRALLTSTLAILACVAMLIGTTFAWFTDTASTGVNKIQAGNLKMEVTYRNAATDGEFAILDENTNVFMEDTLWEPGHVEYAVLNVKNIGTLALKYKLGINIVSETGSTNVNNEAFKLSDYIKYAVIGDEMDVSNRAALVAAAEAADSKLINAGYTSEETPLKAAQDTDETLQNEKTVTLVVWMPTTVGNDANHAVDAAAPTIDLGINVVATQYTHESDSFGKDYDETARYPVADNDSFAETIANIGAGETMVIAPGKYAVPAAAPAAGVTFSGSGVGKTVLKPETQSYKIKDATYKNVTIDGTEKSKIDNNGVIWLDGTDSVLDNVEVIGGGRDTYGYSVRAGANTTIKNSYIHGAFRAVMAYEVKDTLLIENSVLAPQCYTINIDGGTGKLVANNSTLKGWTSYTSSIESATFTDCTFEKNTASGSYGCNYLRPYTDTVLKNCTFGEDFLIGVVSKGFTITIDDCTYKGVNVTAENVKEILDYTPGEYDKIMDCTLIVNGVTVTW